MSSPKQNELVVGLPRLLTPREAASVLSVSPRTLWRMTQAKQIPHLRVGNQLRFNAQELAGWIKSKSQGEAQSNAE